MKATNRGGSRSTVSVGLFFETAGGPLHMELAAGSRGLKRHIPEGTLNRPGLAFSGFYHHFAHRRVQVIGMAEHAYLGSLTQEVREKRLREFFGKKVPCVVVTRNWRVYPEMIDLAEEYRVPVLRTDMITKHFINASTIVLENLMAPRLSIQGTMVEILGIGVLIDGRAGIGKSEAALGLVKRGHSLVSDDVTALRLDSAGCVIASPISVTRYHMEIRGLGIIHVPSLFGVASVREEKRLDLVATLIEPVTDENELAADFRTTRAILGVDIPQVFIQVAPGRDPSSLVETAALDQKLRRLGHDAEKELDERLVALLTGGRDGSE